MVDLLVIGGGIAGIGVCLAGVRRGLRVTLLEAGVLPNGGMPSYGDTRVFRMAYFEAPEYVPFLISAQSVWREWEAEAEVPLFEETGVLMAGGRDTALVRGAMESAGEHDLPLDELSSEDALWEFGAFNFETDDVVLVDREGGFLHARNATCHGLELCKRAGVKIVTGCRVLRVQEMTRDVLVICSDGSSYEAGSVVVCAGAGVRSIIFDTVLPELKVTRQVLTYWSLGGSWDLVSGAGRPMVFAFEEFDGRFYYGIPGNATEPFVKVALHTPDGEEGDREPVEDDWAPIQRWIQSRLRKDCIRHEKSVVCHYDIGLNGQLALGLVPGSRLVGVIGSMSGHGFKFGPALGEAVVSEVIDGVRGVIPASLGARNLFGGG